MHELLHGHVQQCMKEKKKKFSETIQLDHLLHQSFRLHIYIYNFIKSEQKEKKIFCSSEKTRQFNGLILF